jgi:hypothetical protein
VDGDFDSDAFDVAAFSEDAWDFDGFEPEPTARQQEPAVCGEVDRTGTWGY